MTYRTLDGSGIKSRADELVEYYVAAPAVANSSALNATGKKLAVIGRFFSNSKSGSPITKVGVTWGSAITKAGGSGLTLSLQDVDLTTGPVIVPDGTQDQTVAIPASSITASTHLLTAALSANRTIAEGDLVAVVIEFDGGGRLGADSITTMYQNTGILSTPAAYAGQQGPIAVLFGGASWAIETNAPMILFELADGSQAGLEACPYYTSVTTTAFNNATNPEKRALVWRAPMSGEISAVRASLALASGADCNLIVYAPDGTTALVTIAIDSNAIQNAANRAGWFSCPKFAVVQGSDYYITLVPTTANNITIYDAVVSVAKHFDTWPGGQNFRRATNHSGVWTETATARPIGFGLRYCSVLSKVAQLTGSLVS